MKSFWVKNFPWKSIEEIGQMYDDRDARQKAVMEWAKAAFGEAHATGLQQRAIRLLEEAVELFQAAGCSKEKAYSVVDVMFSRPVGDPAQEIGGVSITLLCFAEALGLSATQCEIVEWERICSMPLEHFKKRNLEKDALGLKP